MFETSGVLNAGGAGESAFTSPGGVGIRGGSNGR